MKEQIIEITPLAFCRGRSFKNSYVILDEAQNCSKSQMKMILTRLGEGSKIIVCGDIEQADRQTEDNGLLDIQHKLNITPIKRIQSCYFTNADIRRHELIGKILNLY